MIEEYLATFNFYIDCLVGLWEIMAQNRAICPKLALESEVGKLRYASSLPGKAWGNGSWWGTAG